MQRVLPCQDPSGGQTLTHTLSCQLQDSRYGTGEGGEARREGGGREGKEGEGGGRVRSRGLEKEGRMRER